MTEQVETETLTPEEIEEKVRIWNQEEATKIKKYCFSQGIQPKNLKQDMCQCLPPLFGVWYVHSTTKGEDYWVLSGKFPTDIASASVATNAREAIRHFSMTWQLKAARLEDELAEGKVSMSDKETQGKIVAELVDKAEFLYHILTNDKIWAESGLTI